MLEQRIMDKSIIINQVVTLFLIMAVGFVARKRKILNPALNKGLSDVLLNITAPLLAISSFQLTFSREMLVDAGIILVFALIVHIASIFLGKVFFTRMPDPTGKILRFITIFSNCGFMGYPVIGCFFGQSGVFFTSIYIAVFTLFVWTYGVFIFTGKSDWRSLISALLNPGMIAVVLGMLLFLFSIKLPLPVAQTLEIVGAMNTPISMIIVGSLLADVKLGDLFSGWAIYYGALIRLLLLPLATLFILKGIGLKGMLLGVCVLAVAMPAAAMSVPLAENNQGDVFFASRIVFLTTILSVVTIPMVIWWI
jgi:predicted permease